MTQSEIIALSLSHPFTIHYGADGAVRVRYRRRVPSSLTFNLEMSLDLQTWLPAGPVVALESITSQPGDPYEIVTLRRQSGSPARGFFRVSVE